MHTKLHGYTDDELVLQVLNDADATEREVELAARISALQEEVEALESDIDRLNGLEDEDEGVVGVPV